MSTVTQKVEVNTLKEGMFVSDLDRPWHETPFPLQGFYIQSDDDVRAIANYCRHVYVDIKKAKVKTIYEPHAKSSSQSKKRAEMRPADKDNVLKLPPVVIKSPQRYDVTSPIKKEVSRAGKLHRHVYRAIDDVFSRIQAGGEVSLKDTEHVAYDMVDSVIRNPDALVWLAKMHDQDAHGYRHSVNASIWALVFGRHLGLDRPLLRTLAMGVLLAHIGKTRIAQDLLDDQETLEGERLVEYRQYVQHGVDILENMGHLPRGVIAIARFHQERHNGSGFPGGVTGDRIPLMGKIAGLVDYYQSLITPRDDSKGLSPLDAVAHLYELRNIAFQQDLVERFIEAVGVYPTGTLVELSNQEVALVTGHNMDRRLLPKVMVVLDAYKQPLKTGRLIDLKEWNMNTRPGDQLFIKGSLPKGAYNINETEYLLTGAKSRWSFKHIAGSLMAS